MKTNEINDEAKTKNNQTSKVKEFNFLKSHLIHIMILFLLILISVPTYFTIENTCHGGDCRSSNLNPYIIIENSIKESGQIPLWDKYIQSGEPFFNLGIPVLYPVSILMGLAIPAIGVMNYTLILHLFIGLIGMYFLSYYLIRQKPIALASAVIYYISFLFVTRGVTYWIIGASYVPLIILFILKAFDSQKIKTQILNSIIAGIFYGLLFLGGASNHFIYVVLIMMFIFTYQLIINIKNYGIKKTIKTMLIIGIIFGTVSLGIMAVKLIPAMQWVSYTNRSGSLPWEEVYNVGHLSIDNWFSYFIKGEKSQGTQIGIIGLIMLGFSYYYFKTKKSESSNKHSKNILFLWISIVITIILSIGGYYFLWKYVPGFGKIRGIDRILYVYVVFACMLVSYGIYGFLIWLKNKFKIDGKQARIISYTLVALILIDGLMFSQLSSGKPFKYFNFDKLEDKNILLDNNNIITYIKNESVQTQDIFRIHSYEIKGIDWNDISATLIPQNIEMVYGMYSPIWYPEYFYEYLGASFQSPAKLWGLLNIKYLTSSEELNLTGFEFVHKFEEYADAYPDHSDGPYLYLNKEFLPRAFITKKAILVVGEEIPKKQFMYGLMLQDGFKPNSSVIIYGEKQFVDDYSIEELTKFNVIFLAQGSLSQYSQYLLKTIKDKGVKIIPDVTQGQNSISMEQLVNVFNELNNNSKIEYVNITKYYSNERIIDVSNKQGWLALSEQYKMYGEGWRAYLDGKEVPINRANGVLSAVYLPKGENKTIVFKYFPKTLKIGIGITIITLIGIIGYLGYYFWTKKRK